MTEFEIHGRAHFAEIAEALGVATDQILAARLHKGAFYVLYSIEDRGDDTVLWSTNLSRDASGVLVQNSVPVEHKDLWKRLARDIEKGLKELDDE